MQALRDYYTEMVDRATKTAAQSAILVLGADQIDALSADWQMVAGFAAGGAALSVLTSLAARGLSGKEG